MPIPKKAVKRAAAKGGRKATKRRPQRIMSAAHKRALAEGRAMSATVDRYLSAVNTPKRRGRKVTKATLERRLVAAHANAKSAKGVNKVVAAQAVRDLETRLADMHAASGTGDLKRLEAAFVKIAKQFGENRGIGYGAWRDAGVPADVLKKAGLARTRG
ncbi:MAG: hypothetical protein ACLPVY_23220 [Acidimicrobiia bacterium]